MSADELLAALCRDAGRERAWRAYLDALAQSADGSVVAIRVQVARRPVWSCQVPADALRDAGTGARTMIEMADRADDAAIGGTATLEVLAGSASPADWDRLQDALTRSRVAVEAALRIELQARQGQWARGIIAGLVATGRQATWIVDPGGHVVAANAAAEAQTDIVDSGFAVDRDGRLQLRDPETTRNVRRVLGELCMADGPREAARRITDGSGAEIGLRLRTLDVPGGGPPLGDGPAARLVLLTVCRRDGDLDLKSETIADLFGFTPAETRLIVSLTKGLSLVEHCTIHRIKIATGRWHLHNAMQRTGCVSQSALVSMVLRALI